MVCRVREIREWPKLSRRRSTTEEWTKENITKTDCIEYIVVVEIAQNNEDCNNETQLITKTKITKSRPSLTLLSAVFMVSVSLGSPASAFSGLLTSNRTNACHRLGVD